MSWILPSISSSSGLMGRSLVIPHARNQNPAAETSPIFRLLQSPPQSAALPGIKPTDPPTSREGSEERVRIQHTRSKSLLHQREREREAVFEGSRCFRTPKSNQILRIVATNSSLSLSLSFSSLFAFKERRLWHDPRKVPTAMDRLMEIRRSKMCCVYLLKVQLRGIQQDERKALTEWL